MGSAGDGGGERCESVGGRALSLWERIFETLCAEIKGSAHDLDTR